MKPRSYPTLIVAVLFTVAVDYVLYWSALGYWRLALIVFRQPEGGIEHHGRAVVSWLGVGFVITILLLHAVVLAAVVNRYLRRDSHAQWVGPILLIFGISAIVVMVADPAFLAAVLPTRMWDAYFDFVSGRITPLQRIYDGWAFGSYLPWIAALHGALVAALIVWLGTRDSASAGRTTEAFEGAR